MDFKSKIILISGPTASGKSSFAIKLAQKVNGEIINADSMQVYKQLKILSARPDQKKYQKIRHHLYCFNDVKKNFSTGNWLKLVLKKIEEIKKRKKIPILVGGTGLYFKALTDGLVKIPNIPLKIRNQIRLMHSKIGQDKFYNKLLKLDPASKNKINPTDPHRSIRAYEVKLYTKKSIHEWYQKTTSIFQKSDFYKIYIEFPRIELIDRINLHYKHHNNVSFSDAAKDEPLKSLQSFKKVFIKKDSEVEVKLSLNKRNFSYWDVEKKDWVVKSGKYTISIGSSSEHIELKEEVML